jgi:hypothetical protein
MTKRLYAGLLLSAAVVLMTAASALAERPGAREWTARGKQGLAQLRDLPLFFRSSAGTSWVRVHNAGQSPCSPVDTADSPNGQTIEHVWCFEGPGGDPSWPSNPQGDDFTHWSKFAPPVTPLTKWHMSRMNPNASNWNAWAGCDSLVGVAGFSNNDASCTDVPFWLKQKGYGDNWNFALELRADGVDDNQAGDTTIKFDLRYDTECNYDYLYLEASTNNGTTWALLSSGGTPAVFNSISGNPSGDGSPGNGGRDCGDDFFGNSDQFNPGGGNQNWNGFNHSQWIPNVTFVIPQSPAGTGVRVRWRAFSDGAWSDQDGRGDTDGLAAIDNIVLTVDDDGTPDGTASETFEANNGVSLNNRAVASETLPGAVTFVAGGILGQTWDSWHLEFDPKYSNKGNTCTFSDDWMWAAKPSDGQITPMDGGFDFFLVSPKVNCDGWTGGVCEYAEYLCFIQDVQDYANQVVRLYDTVNGWSPWNDYDGFVTFAGCEFWNLNTNDDITPYLGTSIDSLQVAWELLEFDKPGDFTWGKHGSVQMLIDNVSFGSFDGQSTVFTARVIDIFADTFSLSDPAHTPFLQNPEQGNWSGLSAVPPGTRDFANADSLNVQINDFNGFTANNVDLFWRHDNGGSGSFGPFNKIDMSYAVPDPLSPTDEGTYRAIIGADNGGTEDVNPPANNRLIWKAATTVQYYVKVVDLGMNAAVWPNTADDAEPVYFEYSVLPFGKVTPGGQKILLVDDVAGRTAVDFENSGEYNPTGGAGLGDFPDPVFEVPENLIERALVLLFGGSEASPNWDKYDVQGAGSSVQCEPNGTSNTQLGIGGYMSFLGAPNYDVMIWPQLDLDAYSFADTTRLELKTYLDRNGNLFACGNEIAYFLGGAGGNADSAIGFLGDYFGTQFTNANDDFTVDRTLNVTGRAGTSLAGVELGVFGECPRRWSFDKLALSAPAIGSQNSILADYTDGDALDNGRASIVKNVRRGIDGTFGTADDGVAVLMGFDLSALLSDASRACIMGKILTSDMGITIQAQNLPACVKNGVDAPVVNARYGFQLANPSPNPFTKSTSIQFSIASKQRVTVEVFNILGQKVRTLVDENLDANTYTRDWDGRSDAGERVSNGIYFYKMVAGDFSDTKKAVLLK